MSSENYAAAMNEKREEINKGLSSVTAKIAAEKKARMESEEALSSYTAKMVAAKETMKKWEEKLDAREKALEERHKAVSEALAKRRADAEGCACPKP